MSLRIERLLDRPRTDEELAPLSTENWPEFIFHDRTASQYQERAGDSFAHLRVVLVDEEDALVAAGWGVPIPWSGEIVDLPGGYTGSLVTAVESAERRDVPNTLVIMAGAVRADSQRRGVAGELLTALRTVAGEERLGHVIAPVRPTLKTRYPLTPIEQYAAWKRADGSPFDPWVRTHWRLGATMLATAPQSQTITGTVGEWERWTDMALPEFGQYIVPNGIAVLEVDRERDIGTYVEPNIWMRHA